MTKLFSVLMLLAAFAIMPVVAQDDLTYGDEVEAAISNQSFETPYTFEGEVGDIVLIEMLAGPDANLDPHLYLATLDNRLLTANDDAFNRDARIIYQLPATETYMILAARHSGRFGSDEGPYTLRLSKVEPLQAGVTQEGRLSNQAMPPLMIFVADAPGPYTIEYRHIQGGFYPALTIARFGRESSYPEELGRLDGMGLEQGTLTLNLNDEALYVMSLVPSNYNYSSDEVSVLYTVRVEEAS